MGKMAYLSAVADEVMEYDNMVWDALGYSSWPFLDLDAQRRYYAAFMGGIEKLEDYWNLHWEEQEVVRDRLTDENYHNAVLCLELFKTICNYER